MRRRRGWTCARLSLGVVGGGVVVDGVAAWLAASLAGGLAMICPRTSHFLLLLCCSRFLSSAGLFLVSELVDEARRKGWELVGRGPRFSARGCEEGCGYSDGQRKMRQRARKETGASCRMFLPRGVKSKLQALLIVNSRQQRLPPRVVTGVEQREDEEVRGMYCAIQYEGRRQ